MFLPEEIGPNYRTLDEGIHGGHVKITEVSEGGSVPRLKVVNTMTEPLLIVDGEELIGAKQNRVVNTTLLLRENSETVIPVSCTERGRWSYISRAFSSSDVLMEMKMRKSKLRSVSDSLKQGAAYSSDQGAVWAEIQRLQAKAGHHSPTSAMHDVFAARAREVRAALESFPLQPGQHGLLVGIGNKIAGLDLLSRADAYARLHHKLVCSYVLDALLDDSEPGASLVGDEGARTFLEATAACSEECFPSVGYGHSVRLRDDCLVGAALVHEGAVIHLAAFHFDPKEEGQRWSQMRRFRDRRQRLFRSEFWDPDTDPTEQGGRLRP